MVNLPVYGKAVHLSHNDLDGYACNIPLSITFEMLDRINCDYNGIEKAIDTLIANYSTHSFAMSYPRVIYVTDLVLTQKHVDTLLSYFHGVTIIDHHPQTQAFVDYPKAGTRLHTIFDPGKSATKLTQEHCRQFPSMYTTLEMQRLVDLVDTFDLWKQDDPSFKTAIALNDLFVHTMTQGTNPENTIDHRFAHGFDDFTDEEWEIIQSYEKHRQNILKSGVYSNLPSGNIIAKVNSTIVTNFVAEWVGVPVAYVHLSDKPETGWKLSARARVQGVDLGKVFAALVKSHGTMVKSGGGHACAAALAFHPEISIEEMTSFIHNTIDPMVIQDVSN